MAKKVKFPLKLADGTEARTLEELKEHFDINSVVAYFSDGKLLTWLQARYYDDEADKVSSLAKDDKDVAKKLCAIFDVESEEDVDPEEIARRQERLNRLKQYTDDRDIWERVDQVAFDQEDLGDLLDEDMTLIYLCNNRFTIPLRLTDKTYVGIGKTVAVIRSNKIVDFDALNITFKRIRFDDEYQKILDAPPPSINTNSSFTKSLERAEHFKNQFMRLKKLFSKRDPDRARIKELLHELSKMVESKRYPKEMRLIGDCYKEIGEQQEAEYFYKTAENFSSGQTQSSAFKKNSASTPAHSLANIQLKPGEHFIRSPMTGYIEKIVAKENQFVRTGDVLLVLYAMKMMNEITADTDGFVKMFLVGKGTYVNNHDPLVILDANHYPPIRKNVQSGGTWEATTMIRNRQGIHERPALIFVQKAASFISKIQLKTKGKTVDAKSILMIMSLGIEYGDQVTIAAEGPDARQAVNELRNLIDSGFGER